MKTLVLTEKPSVAREIARVLGCTTNKNGGIIGPKYIVTWALGHLVTLAMPEELKPEWKTWDESTLPMIPKKFETRVIGSTSKQFNCVKSYLKSDEVSDLVIATDAGREGELVARWIIDKVGFKKPMKRLWISSMTDKAIKEGFKSLIDAKNYNRLYDAAVARASADWLVGLNVSRALTVKYNASLSAGRVQTPTLGLIVEREKEIKSFVPKKYYQVHLKAFGNDFILYKNGNPYSIYDKEEVIKLVNKLKGEKFVCKDVKTTLKNEAPPLLYDLTSLQQDANKLYAFTAKDTLNIVQKLYEGYKYLTYPRTDSKHLTTDMYATIKERLINASYGEYAKYARNIIDGGINNSKRIFNNQLVSDHHAIIPTEEKCIIGMLDSDEARVYNLVLKRFLAAFMKDYEYVTHSVVVGNDLYEFKTSVSEVKNLGWKVLYDANSNNVNRTNFIKGLEVTGEISFVESTTKPAERYTEATLLYAMEHAGKFTSDVREKEALAESSGIGTPATRAEIIDRIFSAGYVKLVGRSIHPTEKGMQLIELVPSDLRSVSLTAKQELSLDKISKGKLNYHSFIDEMVEFTKELTSSVLLSNSKYHHDNATTHKCPQCGKLLLDVTNNFGKSLVCRDKECGYKKHVYKISNLRCPTCHKKLKQIGDKESGFFQCECGYKEKCESFFNHLQENKQGMNKKEVRKYLDKQEKEIPKNNPFADFFK